MGRQGKDLINMEQGNDFAELVGMMICVFATLGLLLASGYLFGYIGASVLFADVMFCAGVSVLASRRRHCPMWFYLGSLIVSPVVTYVYLRRNSKFNEPIGR